MNPEEKYRKQIDVFLEKHFLINREIWSLQNKRIDYVLKCKKTGALFGLEAKSSKISQGRELGKYLKQALGYSKEVWKHGFGEPCKMLIFIAPAVSSKFIQIDPNTQPIKINKNNFYKPFHELNHPHHNINSLIGEVCNIGEVKKYYYETTLNERIPYFAFIFRNKLIWSSLDKNNSLSGLHNKWYNYYQEKLLNGKL